MPALTAAAIASGFTLGQYDGPFQKKWFQYCQKNLPKVPNQRGGYTDYTVYYHAQAMYFLGEKGWAKMFPDSKPEERLTWSAYRKDLVDWCVKSQQADGSWNDSMSVGSVYATAIRLAVLQLDGGLLPIYERYDK
jgi:hypothetical protein